MESGLLLKQMSFPGLLQEAPGTDQSEQKKPVQDEAPVIFQGREKLILCGFNLPPSFSYNGRFWDKGYFWHKKPEEWRGQKVFERFRVIGLNTYACIVRIKENPERYAKDESDEYGDFCEWIYDLYIYREGEEEINVRESWGRLKIDPGDAVEVAEFKDEKFLKTGDPVQLAIQFVEEYERPERFRKYLHTQNNTFFVGKKGKPQQEEKPKVYDHEEMAEKTRLEYYRLNPLELDHLPKHERDHLLKTNPYIREAYHLANGGDNR